MADNALDANDIRIDQRNATNTGNKPTWLLDITATNYGILGYDWVNQKPFVVNIGTGLTYNNGTKAYDVDTSALAVPMSNVTGLLSGMSAKADIASLGTAAFTNSGAYDPAGSAAAAQAYSIQRANHTGTQPASTITGLATVATTGAYSDLSGLPTLGTAAAQNTSAFDANGAATSAQAFAVQRANHTGTQSVGTITGLSTVATSGAYSDLTGKPSIPTDTAQLTNGAGFLSNITSGSVTTALGYTPFPTPTGTASQYVRGDGTLATLPSSTGTVTSVGLTSSDFSVSGSPVTSSGNITANLNTSGVSAGSYSNVTVNVKGIVTSGANPSQTEGTSLRSLNTNFTPSATRRARVVYSLNATWTLSALLSGSAAAFLEYSTNGGSAWTTVSQVSKSLALLTFAGADEMNLAGEIPVNALARIRTTQTNMTLTFVRGSEVLD